VREVLLTLDKKEKRKKTDIRIFFGTKKKNVRKSKEDIYDISEIEFINVLCLDGNVNLLFVSLSNIVDVALVNNDDVR